MCSAANLYIACAVFHEKKSRGDGLEEPCVEVDCGNTSAPTHWAHIAASRPRRQFLEANLTSRSFHDVTTSKSGIPTHGCREKVNGEELFAELHRACLCHKLGDHEGARLVSTGWACEMFSCAHVGNVEFGPVKFCARPSVGLGPPHLSFDCTSPAHSTSLSGNKRFELSGPFLEAHFL